MPHTPSLPDCTIATKCSHTLPVQGGNTSTRLLSSVYKVFRMEQGKGPRLSTLWETKAECHTLLAFVPAR